jgi:nitrate reductase NapD
VNVSSILIQADAPRMNEAVARLSSLPGIEVQLTDPASGKIVVTQETETTEEQEAGLRSIQALPGLLSAALVCHYIDDQGGEA